MDETPKETRGRKPGYKRDPETTRKIMRAREEKKMGYGNVPPPTDDECPLEVRQVVAERDDMKCQGCHAPFMVTKKNGSEAINHKEKIQVFTFQGGDPFNPDDNALLCKFCRGQASGYTSLATMMNSIL